MGAELEILDLADGEIVSDDATQEVPRGAALATVDGDDTDAKGRAFYGDDWDAVKAAMDEAAEANAASTPANTTKTYGQGERAWNRYADLKGWAEDGRARTHPTADQLQNFARWLLEDGKVRGADGCVRDRQGNVTHGPDDKAPYSAEAARTLLSGAVNHIRANWGELGTTVNTKGIWAAIGRDEHKRRETSTLATGRGQAAHVTMPVLAGLLDRLAQSSAPAAIRDRAACAVGFTIFSRAQEVAHVRRSDVVVHRDEDRTVSHVDVTVRKAKTADSARTVTLEWWSSVPGQDGRQMAAPWRAIEREAITALLALLDHIDGAPGLDTEGNVTDDPYLFTAADRGGNLMSDVTGRMGKPLTPTSISNMLKAHIGTTFHGIRAGGATWYRSVGMDQAALAKRGGWTPTSAELWKYIREGDALAARAAARNVD